MSKTAYSDRQLRITTVGELCRQGWDGDKPYYDAATVCPNCASIMEMEIVDPRPGESRPEAAERTLAAGGFEIQCPECDCYWYQDTTCVYDHITSKELAEEPYFPYTFYDLPIHKRTQRDPGPWMAAILTKWLHNSASLSAEEIRIVRDNNDLGWRLDLICPLCLTDVDEVDDYDFHHWDYETNVGCALCRRCHTVIHNRMRASDQSRLSPTGDWRDEAFAILLKEYKLHRPLSLPNSAELAKVRLNVPVSPGVISSAYEAKYGDCGHEVLAGVRCEDCGEWFGHEAERRSPLRAYHEPD